MKSHSQSEIIKVPISKLQPYWRNPRNNAATVSKLKSSITNYGFVNPIVVDKNYVIISGHSRYRALQFLGAKQVDVIVSDMDSKLAQEYRLVDNKTSEYATWTEQLRDELIDFNQDVLVEFFPVFGADAPMSEHGQGGRADEQEIDPNLELELICPFTLDTFYVKAIDVRRAGPTDIIEGYVKD